MGVFGGGETGALIRAHDWSASPLGPVEAWPQPLKTLVNVMLGSHQAMFVAWGPERVMLYNDAYAPMLGRRHPAALGRPFAQVWFDIMDEVGPILDRAFAGEPTHMDDIAFVMHRNGYPEEAHFSFSYTPVRDEAGAVAGMFCACAETTGQVLAERRSVGERERLRRMFEQAPGLIAMLSGPEHVFEVANPGFLELIGRGDIIGKPVREAAPELVGQGFVALLDEVYRSGEPYVGAAAPSLLRRTAEGPAEERLFDFVYQPLTDAAGNVTGIFAGGQDVTERARAEIERSRLAAVIEQSSDFIGIATPDGCAFYVNEAGRRIVGLKDLEAVRKTRVTDFFAPEDAAFFKEVILPTQMREGRWVGEFPFRRFDTGEKAPMHYNQFAIRDAAGAVIGMAAVARDVSEDKRRADALRASEAALRVERELLDAVIRQAPVGISIVEAPSGRPIALNDKAIEITGHGAPGGDAGRCALYGARHPDGRPYVIDEHPTMRALRRGETVAGEEAIYRYGGRDGAGPSRRLALSSAPVRDESGAIVAAVTTLVDLEDRYRAEEALRASEARYRQIVEGAEDFAIVTLDERGVITSWNSGAERITGFAKDEALGQPGAIFFTPEDRAAGAPEQEMRRARSEGRAIDERWHRRKDGGRFWGSGLMTRMEQPGGGYLKIFRDRTAEHEAEARFRTLAEAIPQLVWTSLPEGRWDYASRQWLAYTGQAEPEALGLGWLDAVHPDDREITLRAWSEAEAAGKLDVEHRLRRRGGAYRWFQTAAAPLRGEHGAPTQWFGACTDVDDVRQAQEAVRASEQRFRALVTAGTYAVYRMSPDWREMRRLDGGGFLSDTASPSERWIEDYLHPEDQPQVAAAIREAVRTKGIFELEHRVRRADGTLGWTHSRAVPILGAQGEIVEWFGAASDVTARREAEERQRLLVTLSDRLRDAASEREMMSAGCELLGRRLAAMRVGYSETEADNDGLVRIEHDWCAEGAASIAGLHRMSSYGPDFERAYREGRTVAIEDFAADPRSAGLPAADRHAALGVRAKITVPLVKGGRLAALLFVHAAEPRRWTEEDERLVREVAERTWAAVERARAEAALSESEARFREVANSAPVLIWMSDAAKGCAWLNQPWLDFTGRSMAQERGSGWWEGVHPDDLPRCAGTYDRAFERREPFRMDYRLRRRDGEWRVLDDSGVPRFAEDGTFLGFIGSCVDVTEQRSAERALRESEEQRRLATEAAEIGLWDVDVATGALFWQPRVNAMFGISPEVPVSMADFYAGLHPEDRERTVAAFAAALDPDARALYDVEYRTVGKEDGVVRWVAAKGRAQFDDGNACRRITGTAIDITARKAGEIRSRALVELTDRFRALTDPADLSFAAAEILGRTLGVSRAGYGTVDPVAETITIERDWNAPGVRSLAGTLHFRNYGSYIEDLKRGRTVVFADAEKDPRTAATADALKAISAQSVVNMPVTEHGGFIALLYLNHATARAWSADELAFIGEVAERTRTAIGRSRAEQDLLRLAASLEQQVEERTAELVKSQEALAQSQKMEAVGQLTGGIAHDFNNLLQGVAGSLDLIRRRPQEVERVRRWAEAGLQAAERGAKLTGQLLAFSRAQKLQLKPLLVSDLVGGMRELLARTLGPLVKLTIDLAPDPFPVCSDPTQLEMAVLNLAINARDAMAEGGDLSITTRPVRVDRDAELESDDYVELTVADTGSGMSPEVIARAFDPFFTTKGLGKGTGLGLSQVYGIARQAGGTVRIESRPGRGTSVRLLLRRTEAPVAAEAGPGEAAGEAGGRAATVLVVDDDPDVRRFLADSLDGLGYRVVEAEDGPAGLAALERAAPDLMLIDFAMPGMTGAEVARVARARRADLPIVFASGYADTAAVEDVAGSRGVILRKPFRIDELQAVVAEALGSRSAEANGQT